MKNKLRHFLIPILMLAMSPMAQAVVVTFDDVPSGGCLGSGTVVQSVGFVFTLTSTGTAIVCDSSSQARLASNGTNYLAAANTTGGVFSQSFQMTAATGESFDLASLQLGELFRDGDFAEGADAAQVRIVGNLQGGGTVTAVMILDGFNDGTAAGADFQTFTLPASFVNLTSVDLIGEGSPGFNGNTFNIFTIDNVDASIAAPTSTTFSIAVIPDTQMYAEQHPEVFEAQMDWIVANQAAENIVYVAHLGDIKDDGLCDTKTVNVGTGGGRSEWQIVDQAIAKLDTANIPYGLAVGNHDFDQPGSNRCPNWTTERPLGTYNSLFGPNRYIGDAHYGDPNATPPRPGNRVVNSNEDNFALFEASGVKFIAINLAYKEAANQSGVDPELDWADDLLKTYDDRIGIVNSHFFVWENPERSNTDPNDEENVLSSYGQEVYDRLSINQNLFLMMSAHRWGEAWRVENTGRNVSWPPTQILLADYQRYFFPFGDGDPNTPFTDPNPALLDFGNLDGSGSFGDSGLMRIMRFDTTTGMVNVETFIPPVVPIKGRPSTIVSTYFPASGDEMDKDTASNFSFSYLGYTP